MDITLYKGAYTGPQVDSAIGRALTGGAIDTEISNLRAAVGSPLVASTVAEMTNTGKVYVYTGSEAGYTAGNWYYWNGSAWVSGGVYNGYGFNTDPVPTDGSTNPVESNGVYDALALKADLASPALTGTPTAPTATEGDASSQIANTEWVVNALAKAYPTDTVSGDPAVIDDGADSMPVKALSATASRDYGLALYMVLGAAGSHAVTPYSGRRWQSIVFPCETGTTYTVTSGVSAHMRIASFADYPAVGDVPAVYAETEGSTITISTVSEKWVLVQMFTDDDTNMQLGNALASGFGISPAPVWSETKVTRLGKNLVDVSALFAGRWLSGGSVETTYLTSRFHTALIPVVGGASYVWSAGASTNSTSYAWWFDENLAQISNSILSSDATSAVLTAPDNAVYVSLSYYNAQNSIQFERGGTATTIEGFKGQTVMLDLSDGTTDTALTTVYGKNDIYADCGAVTVAYRADVALYIQKKIAEATA